MLNNLCLSLQMTLYIFMYVLSYRWPCTITLCIFQLILPFVYLRMYIFHILLLSTKIFSCNYLHPYYLAFISKSKKCCNPHHNKRNVKKNIFLFFPSTIVNWFVHSWTFQICINKFIKCTLLLHCAMSHFLLFFLEVVPKLYIALNIYYESTWLSGMLVITARGSPKPRKYGQLISTKFKRLWSSIPWENHLYSKL